MTPPDPPTAALLETLERSLLDPAIRSDTHALSALLRGDFVEFGSSGSIFTKDAILQALRAEASEPPQPISLHDLRCDLLAPSVALLTFRSERHHPDGSAISALRSSVWMHTSLGWQLRFHQGTRRNESEEQAQYPPSAAP